MMTTFMATIAFSLGLLAFCSGAWLTIWSGSTQCKDSTAARLSGYFVTILAIGALVFSAYYVARGIFLEDQSMSYNWSPAWMQSQPHHMHHSAPSSSHTSN